jgi:predicted RNA-binding protein with PUA-like domain
MRVVRAGYPDPTAFDKKHRYYDPKSDSENPRWYLVDVQLERRFTETIALSELRRHARLARMKILQKGNRLSITPVTPAQWKFIFAIALQLGDGALTLREVRRILDSRTDRK